ncbi:hypothetical protein PHPALM_27459, partial [Phytophthora palmivora]
LRDPSTKQGKVKAEPYRLVGSPIEPPPHPPKDPLISRSDKKKPKKKLTRKEKKAPEMDDEDQIGSKPRSRSGQGWSDEDLVNIFYHKELREFLDLDPVMRILKLKQGSRDDLTGAFDADDVFDLDLKVIQTATKDLFSKLKILVGEIPQITDPVPLPPASIMDRQTTSSHYASAAEDESDLSSEPKRMSLGPSDDIDFPAAARATVATATTGSAGSTMIQRVRMISDLKEFTGKDQDEDRARAWIGKVKSVFMRDQASDEEIVLTFADLLAGSTKNWYR